MDRNEIATVNDLDERERKLRSYLISEFESLKKLIEEQAKPYLFWPENMSMKQVQEYTGRSKSTILTWVKDKLLVPYEIGSSTSIYYSKSEIDSLRARWEGQKRNRELRKAG